MNILFFLRDFPIYGGVERITITLANALQNRGYNVYILSNRGNASELLSDLHPTIKVLYIKMDNYKLENTINHVFQIFNDYKIDIVLNQGCYEIVTLLLMHLKNRINIKIISLLHNDPLAEEKNIPYVIANSGWKAYIKKIFLPLYYCIIRHRVKKHFANITNISNQIVLLSASFKESFCKYVPSAKSKITIIPNCFLFEEDILCKKEKCILYVGRVIERQKHLSRLFDIWSIIALKHEDWELIIVGDGSDLATYKNNINERRIPRIRFVGYQKDVIKFMRTASIITLVSDYEGFPMVLIEAMKESCVPIVYGSYSAVYDIIDNNVNGIIVPPFDQSLFIDNLDKLLENPALLTQMSYKASLVANRYSVEKITPYWEELLAMI